MMRAFLIAALLLLFAVPAAHAASEQYPITDSAMLAPYLAASENLLDRLYPNAERHCPDGLKFFSASDLGMSDMPGVPAFGLGGDCKIWLTPEWWALNPYQDAKSDLCAIIAHERAHAELWLEHSNDPASLMYPGQLAPQAECEAAFPDNPQSSPQTPVPAPVAAIIGLRRESALAAIRSRVGRSWWRVRLRVDESSRQGDGSWIVTAYSADVSKRVCKRGKCKKKHRRFVVKINSKRQIIVRRTNW